MDWLLWLAAGAFSVAVVLVIWGQRSRRNDEVLSEVDQAALQPAAPGPPAPAARLEVRHADAGALELWSRDIDRHIATIEARPLPVPADAARAPAWVARVVETVALEVPELSHALRAVAREGDLFVVRFPAEIMTGMRDGSVKFMQSGNDALAVAVDTASGHYRSHARVAGTLKEFEGLDPGSLFASAVAGAAAYQHQRWLEDTLDGIHTGIAALADRVRDDDHGRLSAALAHARRTEDFLLHDEQPPPYFKTGVVTALADVESVYFSRRRFAQRFIDALERQQITHEEKSGERAAWAKKVDEAFGDPQRFAAEMMVYAHATAARARITATEAILLANEGSPGQALRLLQGAADEINDDFHDLGRRVGALARSEPTRKLRDLHPMVEALHETLDGEVRPTLPSRRFSDVDTVMHLPMLEAPPHRQPAIGPES